MRLFFYAISLTMALLIASLCLAAPARAAGGRELLQKAREHYDFAEFDQAEKLLGQALRDTGLSPADKAEVYLHFGLIALARGNQAAAEHAFSRAHRIAPGYRPAPGTLPPKAEALFNKVAPPPPAAPVPKRGYVLSVGPDGILLDMGMKQGVKKGNQFAVIVTNELVHPVTKANFSRKRQVALLRVAKVEPETSLAKLVQGALEEIKPGQRLEKRAPAMQTAPPSSTQPTQTAPPAAAPQQSRPGAGRGKVLRVAVLPPALEARGSLQGMDQAEIPPEAVAKALNILRPLHAFVPSDKDAEALLKAKGSALGEIMKRMDLDMVLSWGVSQQEYDERATVFCLLTKRSDVSDELYESILVNDYEFRKNFAKLVTRVMAKIMGYI